MSSTVLVWVLGLLLACVTNAFGIVSGNAERADLLTLILSTGPEKLMRAILEFRDDIKSGTDQSKKDLFGFYAVLFCNLSLRQGSKTFENLYSDEYLTTKLIFEKEERKQERLLTLVSLFGVVHDSIQTLSSD